MSTAKHDTFEHTLTKQGPQTEAQDCLINREVKDVRDSTPRTYPQKYHTYVVTALNLQLQLFTVLVFMRSSCTGLTCSLRVHLVRARQELVCLIQEITMKKQASLLSFFTKSPNPKNASRNEPIENQTMNTPKLNTPPKALQRNLNVKNDAQMKDGTSTKRPPIEELSPVKKLYTPKRRRVVVSSDSEDGDAEIPNVKKDGEGMKNIPRYKSVKSNVLSQSKSFPKYFSPETSSSERSTSSKPIISEMAVSFINSFRATEQDLSLSASKLDGSIDKRASIESQCAASFGTEVDIGCVRFPHLDFDFLQPELIRDADKRLRNHPDYCPRTLYVPETFMKKQTPGHRQWWAAKSAYFDTVLFFKVGKFYEMYHMDAVIGVENLNLNYMRGNFAHCGFPEVAYGRFADQLVNRGYKVARVEQTETPTQLESRNKTEKVNDKVVRREVCNVTTPGTRTYGILDGNDEQGTVVDVMDTTARYLYAIAERGAENVEYGVCFIDTTVGRFYIGRLSDSGSRSALRTLFAHYQPAQILYERGRVSASTMAVYNTTVSAVSKDALIPKKEFLMSEHTLKLLASDKYFGRLCDKWPTVLLDMMDRDSVVPKCNPAFDLCISALGAVIWYLKRCFVDVDMISLRRFELYKPVSLTGPLLAIKNDSEVGEQYWSGRRLILDSLTLKHLNIIPPISSAKKFASRDPITMKYTLYNVINKCVTPAGKRLLRQWVCAPVCDHEILCARQDAIEWLSEAKLKGFIEKAIEWLRKIPDLERLIQKIHTLGLKYRAEEHPDSRAQMFESMRYNKRKIRDLIQALEGFERIQDLRVEFLKNFDKTQEAVPLLLERCFGYRFPDIAEDLEHFKNAFNRDKAQGEGIIVPEKGVIKEYDEVICNVEECIHELDLYLNIIRKQLHCSNINFFGSGRSRYQLEIPEAIASDLGHEFELKSSRKGYKRMVTVELEKLVENLDEAENQRDIIQRDIMRRVFADFGDRSAKWTTVVERMATFDVLLSLTHYSQSSGLNMCRPQFIYGSKQPILEIKSGYHPSLAAIATSGGNFSYIPNSVLLGGKEPSTILLTGPNMGGKSTLMRQVGVLVVLAQIGSFVPADEMKLSPVDRIFTRMGAGDRITAGQSTFYVELYETNLILRYATCHSLVIMDELGRGTSTYDGTAIAYAVLMDLATRLNCRTFFSTHYHSLCKAVENVSNIKAAHMACIVENENAEDPTMENVTFLYTLADGICPKSYGFFAAKISGLRKEVILSAFAASRRLNTGIARKERIAKLRELALNEDCSTAHLRENVYCCIYEVPADLVIIHFIQQAVAEMYFKDDGMNYTSLLLGKSFSFWEKNGSIMLPGDINLHWEDYREIVQPDKASFWVMLGSLLLFIVWIVFITYYMSRVIGPIAAFLLTRVAHIKGYDVQISMARYFGLEKLFVPLKDETDVNKIRRFTTEKELEWDNCYDNLWSLIGYVRLDISSGRLVAGNALLPSMIVSSFENCTSEVSLKEYSRGDDVALLSIIGGTENVRVTLVQCSQFSEKTAPSYNGRCDPPPRTMGDGFAIIQTAHLNFFYSQSILGVVKEGQQSVTEDLPVWESVWRFDKNTVFSYGPWADAQRVLLYDFFFPPEYRNSEVTTMPKEGERRILLAHDMRISLWNDAAIDIWFMRGDELNALHLRVKQGSSVDFKMPWITTENGYETVLRCCLLFIESSTSLAYPKFFHCETLRLTLNVHYPRVFNGYQLWKFAIKINKASTWALWDHKHFFADLINEWTADSAVDLFKFVPYRWEFEINGMDGFELTLLLNEHNWIDASSSVSAENHLATIVGENVTISFALPFLDFCPKTITTVYEIKTRGMVALRAWLPPKSPLYSILHSLLRYASFNVTSSKIKNLPAVSHLAQDWVELWRTEKLTLFFEYTNHPLYYEPASDLPLNVIEPTGKKQTAPINLPPDQLLLEITDVAKINSDTPSSPLYGNAISGESERYRPLSLRFCLRVGKIRGFCPVYSSKMNSSVDSSPEARVDEIVLEIVKDAHSAMVQVGCGIASLKFKPSSEFPVSDDGLLVLEAFSFRGQALFSDLDVPWDAATLEYGWLMEISVSRLLARLQSSEIAILAQCIEALALLAFCSDDNLLIPEKYDFCIHMNDLRTCPYAALNLAHRKTPIQNCESEENLKYESLRFRIEHLSIAITEERSRFQLEISPIRLAYCNCHSASFCSNILLNLSSAQLKQIVLVLDKDMEKWIECGSLSLNDISFDVCLPYEMSEAHLFLERKNFLTNHDKHSKSGYSLMCELNKPSLRSGIKSGENIQPVIGQSIFHEGKWMMTSENFAAYKNISISEEGGKESTVSERKTSSNDSFHSAFSSANVSVYHHMVGPIMSSAILHESYGSFLSVYERKHICDGMASDSGSKPVEFGLFRKVTSGINDLMLIEQEEKQKLTLKKDANDVEVSASDGLSDQHTMNIKGTLGSQWHIFITPLALEVTQRILEKASASFMFMHPVFIVQHLYTLCSSRHHSQPLTKAQSSELTHEKSQTRLQGSITFPDINIVSFQCGMIEKTIQPSSLEDSVSRLTRSSVVLLRFHKSVLFLSSDSSGRKRSLPGMEFTVKGHAQFLQLVESWKLDFAYNKSFSLKYSTNWNQLNLNSRFSGYDLRVVIDGELPDITLKINSGGVNNKLRAFSPGSQDQLSLIIGPCGLTVGLCKPVEQTTSMEWPFFDVFAPCITAWIYATDRLNESLTKNVTAIDEWIDFALIRLLLEVMDCNNGQLFVFEKSCFADVQLYNKAASSCPSCMLATILLRYAAQEDLNNYWEQVDYLEMRHYLNETRRKQALVALLSHWQTIICSQVKISNTELAHRYVEHLMKSPTGSREVRVTIDSNHLNNSADKSGGSSSALDLYHWVLAKHREHKEAVTRNRAAKKLLDDVPVNAMEIALSAFFWSFYEARGLQSSKAFILLPIANIDAKFLIELASVKVDILEPKMISASNVNYLSTTRHHLLHLDSLDLVGQIRTEPRFDEFKLRPVRICMFLSYNSSVQNIRIVFPFVAVCLFNDLSRVTRSCASAFSHLKTARTFEASKETMCASKSLSNPSMSDFGYAGSACWLQNVINKLQDYQSSQIAITQLSDNVLEMKVNGNMDIKVAVLEMTLTHLYISTTLKRTRLEHINRRDKVADNKILDELNASMQRANLILSEFVIGHDAKHIVSFLVKTSSLKFEREKYINGPVRSHINVLIGDIEGDTPIHAQNLHEVVLRNVSQLNEQITRLEYSTPTPVGEYSAHLQKRQGVVVMNFELLISSIELSAQLLPSLKVKYRLDQAHSCGNTGSASKFTGRIKSHVVHFTVMAPTDDKRTSALNSDTFTLILPHISANGAYRMPEKIERADEIKDENLLFREGGYIDVVLIVGKLEHVFTTDLLNQILFAEQCFRAELTSLIDRIIGDRTVHLPAASEQLPVQDPFLFTITLRGETAPWLQLTASTPTSVAVRLTFDNITATLTNRWTRKGADSETKRLYGKAVIGMSTKLGLLVKTAMFEEIETELQEFATFMTQITLQNKNSSVPSAHSYVVTVNRPILLIKSSAIDKAILLWLNYKNTYDFWHEERKKMLKAARRSSVTSTHVSTPLNVETEMNVSLLLKVTNGIYVCMPLYSADLSENLSALLISLQSTDISVCVKKELACQATFHKFKVKFIDNFDDQALNDTWIGEEPGDPRSNYFYFPQGTYQLVSRATAASDSSENAKWTLSVKWQMCGMVIDLDHRIGKHGSLLISTFSSLASDISEEDWEELANESSLVCDDEDEQDAEIDATGELGSLAQPEERIQWLERKMHEQSVLVTDLMQCGASEPAIEKERRTLRKLESARFKQFRKSIIEKLKRNAVRQRKKLMEPKKSEGVHEIRQISNTLWSEQSDDPSHLHSAIRKNAFSGLQIGGVFKGSDRGPSNGRSLENNVMASSVDMNIDVQVSIESGLCTLRALGRQEESTGLLTKRPSVRDLKSKISQTSESILVTKLAIPSVDVRGCYTSLDTSQMHRQIPRHLQAMFSHKYVRSSLLRRPAFYLSVELASMPQESLMTPHLADFLEQMLETIPENNVDSSVDVSLNEMVNSDVSIVEMDTSVIPLDVLFHLTVHSSTIRFEGQQQRTAAADCLLKLPSLTLMASTRPLCEGASSGTGDTAGGGIHVAATLSAFSLNIYSPHQRSTAQDALLLTLDHLSILASRSKNSRLESDNKVQFVLTADVGAANFNYDMRRLAELISFPKPWYRHTIMRRLFFGGHSMKTPTYNTEMSLLMSHSSWRQPSNKFPLTQVILKKKEWSAVVICGVKWKELNISAQMANTMGNTNLILSKIEQFLLTLVWNQQYYQLMEKPPRNFAKLELEEVQSRIEWMSRPIFIAKCEKPSVKFLDEWITILDDAGEVLKASVAVNITCSWSDLQLIITKVTVDDLIKIAQKLRSFFQEQLTNSRMVWGIRSSVVVEKVSPNVTDRNFINFTKYHHWQSVLDMLTHIQARQKLLPMPKSADGITVVGGVLELSGQSLSLACMHGEMNAGSWALFHMRQPTIIFEPEARYIFINDNQDVGVLIAQRLNIRLGDVAYQRGDTECMAVVCRVQQSRGSMVRQMSSVLACLHHVIGDVLVRLKYIPSNLNQPAFHHSVLELFQFPALDAVLSTLQKQGIEADEEISAPEIRSSFICEFHDSVNVQTDFSAQVSFLPELINTYMKIKVQLIMRIVLIYYNCTKEEKAVDINRDFRRFVCERWVVDPKICFIDRFKWNPPVIDEILRKLQIFDHRTTIPKALQRGLLDPCDALLAEIELFILLIASKSCKKASFSKTSEI
uniref:DNA mismatch repair proteins mutS family domain-containing protein n=1 Tax=Setaria digitata TaxID=48799 RepID=A0A915Q466_9BILA